MTWFSYAMVTVGAWTMWGFVGKLALKTATPLQAGVVYGVAVTVIAAIALAGAPRASWSPSGLTLSLIAGLCGGIGLIAFYLALEQGKASLVAPLVGMYPALVAVLSVLFLSERLSALQSVGIVLALSGVVLIGAGQ